MSQAKRVIAKAAAMQAISLETTDHREAFTAFKEKRTPNFTGT
jgi:enoyl-CoA hydratase/carnithine racemase